ncbi:hypothetical protein SVAN01_11222 [Stagonosporopsis vannaccii]|nr:hypothetical protein SVAN01_11222 [Stagonosporopsis vannaccii]
MRAEFHQNESKRIGQLVTIAVRLSNYDQRQVFWKILLYSVTTRQVKTPVWVHRSVRLANASSIPAGEVMAACANLFACIREPRSSELVKGHSRRRSITADSHGYEWLARSRILESRIMKVILFDGKDVHMVRPPYTVRCEAATDGWIFDFDLEPWRVDSGIDGYDTRKHKRTELDCEALVKEIDDTREFIHANSPSLDFSVIATLYSSVGWTSAASSHGRPHYMISHQRGWRTRGVSAFLPAFCRSAAQR